MTRRRRWAPEGAKYIYRSTAGKLPEPGMLVGWRDRSAWRVVAVHEVHQANWCPESMLVWEQAGRPDPETWSQRERSAVLEPPRNPAPNGRDRVGRRLFPWWSVQQWWELTDPFPVCVDCGLLWPCPCDDRNHEAAAAMAEVERLGGIMPGCCWGCGEPITGRQHSIEFDGENLLLPGAGPAVFHTSHSRKAARGPSGNQTCRGEADAYERRWLAAASGRKARLTCPGNMFRHVTYSECTRGVECPGEGAAHAERWHCTTAHFSSWSAEGGSVETRPLTNCGERGCRGLAMNTAPTIAGISGAQT